MGYLCRYLALSPKNINSLMSSSQKIVYSLEQGSYLPTERATIFIDDCISKRWIWVPKKGVFGCQTGKKILKRFISQKMQRKNYNEKFSIVEALRNVRSWA